jgi:hypothetical protein
MSRSRYRFSGISSRVFQVSLILVAAGLFWSLFTGNIINNTAQASDDDQYQADYSELTTGYEAELTAIDEAYVTQAKAIYDTCDKGLHSLEAQYKAGKINKKQLSDRAIVLRKEMSRQLQALTQSTNEKTQSVEAMRAQRTSDFMRKYGRSPFRYAP